MKTLKTLSLAIALALACMSSQALAMAEYGAPYIEVPLHRGGTCAEVEGSYIVEGFLEADTPVTVSISVTAHLEDGGTRDLPGHPVFVYARTQAALEKGARVHPSKDGRYTVAKSGYVRILAEESMGPPPSGVSEFAVNSIRICPL